MQLSGAVRAATPEVGEKNQLPRVLVIGDSISIGYIKPLAELLKDKAAVERPHENCGSSRRILDNFDQFLGDTRWDVIQFNCGIHDLTYLNAERKSAGPKDGGKHQVPLDEYRANLKKIVDRLRQTACQPAVVFDNAAQHKSALIGWPKTSLGTTKLQRK